MKINRSLIIADFQRMYREKWKYTAGAAQTGDVDCSGAFVWSYKQHGKSIYHGSNKIARAYVHELLPVNRAEAGMAAFKLYAPGDSRWKLPDQYKGDPDQNDYYHIGLVDEDGKYVLNAQGTAAGFTRTPISKWGRVAYLNDVDYRKEPVIMEKATIVLPAGAKGSTVNMRSGPGTDHTVLARVPVGATVEVSDDLGVWVSAEWNGKSGYIMSNYIEYQGHDDPPSDDWREEVKKAYDILGRVLVNGVG